MLQTLLSASEWLNIVCDICSLATEFIDQPLPGRILSPIGTAVQLNCTVSEGCTAHWRVVFSGSDQQFTTDGQIGLIGLMRRGIQPQSQSPTMSQLIFNATLQLQATVRCICFSQTMDPTLGSETEVIIYGM